MRGLNPQEVEPPQQLGMLKSSLRYPLSSSIDLCESTSILLQLKFVLGLGLQVGLGLEGLGLGLGLGLEVVLG